MRWRLGLGWLIGNGPDGAHFDRGVGLGGLNQIVGQTALLLHVGGDDLSADAGRV
jgi:hypothetical protein